ncbi:class I adenylate-forming enzyme family protein [Bradyrhizobium sp. RDM4]|uniref:class I adenylate-forming enzyme family protein n=1 Tax=Bradyrhizobium sp. RDM4 TaxID=3378765 RepID=UPI0038FCFF59
MIGAVDTENNDAYAPMPWKHLYDAEARSLISHGNDTILAAFDLAVKVSPDEPACLYFDRSISYRELDDLSDAFAAALNDSGIRMGERVAVFLQNVPQFVIVALATWKLGGVLVPINPMNTEREVSVILADSGSKVLVAQDILFTDVVAKLQIAPEKVFTTSTLDYQLRNDERLFASFKPVDCGMPDLVATIAENEGRRVDRAVISGSDIAMLVYTSGTTGVPKGAMNTHGGAIVTAESIARWMHVDTGAPILGVAPLFHITGSVAGIALAFVRRSPLILAYRFHPRVIAEAIEEHRAEVTFCAITALMALLNDDAVTPDQTRSLTKIITGGAPMPPAILEQLERKFGRYIYHGYGLTETNGPVFLVPADRTAPLDTGTGALSVGIPTPHMSAWIADDDGSPAPVGEPGEIIISGGSLASGYWGKPDETATTMRPSGLRSGDVGFMDADGWFYIVDRKKDMINAGGYKVWPREVEDVIYTHPSIREAAVVGVPDAYRGETVRAVVSLKNGTAVTPEELKIFCKERMAAYKYPRIIDIIEELPKNMSGKILRRLLREQSASQSPGSDT